MNPEILKNYQYALCGCHIKDKTTSPVWRGDHCPECGTHVTKDGKLLSDDEEALKDWEVFKRIYE